MLAKPAAVMHTTQSVTNLLFGDGCKNARCQNVLKTHHWHVSAL